MAGNEIFESIRPHIQRMIDAHIAEAPPGTAKPPVIDDVKSVVMMQDNVTGVWHRVFLWNGVLYRELADANAPPPEVPPGKGKPPDNGINPPLYGADDKGPIDLIPKV